MSRAQPAPLSSNLVARKGQAAPAAPPAPDWRPPAAPLPPAAREPLTSLTLKLDDARYRRLKLLGARRPRRTGQDILVAALDAYLDAQEA